MFMKGQAYSWERKRREHHARRVMHHARRFHVRYGNLVLIVLGIIAGVWLIYNPDILLFLAEDESLGYAGTFALGFFYPYGVTTPAAIAGFFLLGKTISPWLIALVGAAGALISDFLIFYFIRHKLLDHLDRFTKRFNVRIHVAGHMVQRHSTLKHLVPIVAGMIVASPLPTEIAIGIFAAIKFEMKKFLLYAFLFHFVSILIVSQVGRVI